jgi:predicted TIM-barrel fold metal-dependent hydrolase
MTRVISADCHVNEPPWVFDPVPAGLRDRAPRMMRGRDAGDGWSFDGKPPKRTFGVEAMAGRSRDSYQKSGLTFDQILPGNYDGAAHLEDMDLDGIDVSVVDPASAIFIYLEPDRELALACARAYNDWILEDFQGVDPQRLVGLPMLPVDDGMDIARRELERVVAKGANAAFIPGMPCRPYNDPYYEPLWKAAAEIGVPVTSIGPLAGRHLMPTGTSW